jgi:DNA-binding transcriptional LysR family regulator
MTQQGGIDMQTFDPVTARLLVVLAESGSIGRAADRQNIAPSAVSRRISDLEARLGVSLFDRSTQGVRLTPAGRIYVEGVRTILREIADLDTAMADFAEGRRGNLRLACTSSALAGRLPELLADYAQRYPTIALDIQEMNAAGALLAIDDGQADLAIVADNNDFSRYDTRVFEDDQVYVLSAPDHPVAERLRTGKPIAFEEVAGHEVVGIHHSGALDRLLSQAAASAGRTLGERVNVESFPSLVRMVEAGFGIGFLRATSLHLLTPTDVVAAPLENDWAKRQLLVAHRRSGPVSRSMASFLDLCTQTYRPTAIS